MKRISFVILLLCLLLCALPMLTQTVQASSGTCGDAVTWNLNSQGTLTISGTGPMSQTWPNGLLPWDAELEQIKAMIINEGVTTIGPKAFRKCSNLTQVTLPESLEVIHTQAFDLCTSLKTITIPDGVTEIKSRAFKDCSSLETVQLPKDLTLLDASVFIDCSALREIAIPEGVTKLNNSTFSGCTALRTVTLPKGLLTMGSKVFYQCAALQNFAMPTGVTDIGNQTFQGCTSLTRITIPGSMTQIKKSVFEGCTGLTQVVIPEGITKIGDFAFRGCTQLESLTLPSSLTSIVREAFNRCTSLSAVCYAGDQTAWAAITVGNLNEALTTAPLTAGHVSHMLIPVAAVTGTCVTEGNLAHWRCSQCHRYFADASGSREVTWEQVYQPGTGHTAQAQPAKAATCTADGNIAYWQCTGCLKLFADGTCSQALTWQQIQKPAPGHTVVTDPAVEPTCTQPGLTAGTHCDVCKAVLTAQTVRKAFGHTISHDPAVEPTCTQPGLTSGTHCGYCRQILTAQEVIQALGHSWDAGVVVTPPTATQTGEARYTCLVCGETELRVLAQLDQTCTGGEDCPGDIFTDMPSPGNWAHAGIDYAVSRGLFQGMRDTTFGPAVSMSRSMVVTVLWRYEGEPTAEPAAFDDVNAGRWYTDAVAWASEQGIVNGVGQNRFDPKGLVTREQLATILYRYGQYLGLELVEGVELSSFPDEEAVHSWAEEAMAWAVAQKLIEGTKTPQGVMLDPGGNATRAQVATILMRFLQPLETE